MLETWTPIGYLASREGTLRSDKLFDRASMAGADVHCDVTLNLHPVTITGKDCQFLFNGPITGLR